MNQSQRLDYLLNYLLSEAPHYNDNDVEIPAHPDERRKLLRALMNVRGPEVIDSSFLAVQDAFLQEECRSKGVVDAADLPAASSNPCLALWQGDITRLKVDAIVNAANSAMLGCFVPLHGCIDNAIGSYAGVQLRRACYEMMAEQGHEEATGGAKLTSAYNLPCKHVIHTVGPIISGGLKEQDCQLLAACYRSCLDLAAQHALHSIAFCCISTGEFHFPNERAAEIALSTVTSFLRGYDGNMQVIFNVFKDSDYAIYKRLLDEA